MSLSSFHVKTPRSFLPSKLPWKTNLWYQVRKQGGGIINLGDWDWHIHTCCRSVSKSCPTLWDPVDCSTPGFLVLHYLPELVQTHVHWVDDAIQPSHPLSSPSPPAFNLSQRQGLFQWVSSWHQVVSWADTHLSGVLALPDTYVLIQLSRASHCSCPLRGALVIILMTMKTLTVLYKTLSFFVLQCTLVAVEMQSLLMRSRCSLCRALWDTSLAPRERGCIHNLCHYN